MLEIGQRLNVHFLPQFVPEHELAGSTVVVIDLLRASTTICHALAAGAESVIPFVEISETVQAAAAYDRSQVLMGGERGGEIIGGFDLGNSPLDYTADVVFGKTILFTTTNGTRALQHARLARQVIVGAIVNLGAIVESLGNQKHVDILCAGTRGHVTREDILAAGAIIDRLVEKDNTWKLNESAERAEGEWEELINTARASGRSVDEQLALELRETQGGKDLLSIGHDEDLLTCAKLDTMAVVPELDIDAWRIFIP